MTVYQNQLSVDTAIREAFKLRMQEITLGNDYKNDVKAVLDGAPVSMNDITSYPTLCLVRGEEKSSLGSVGMGSYDSSLKMTIYAFLQEATKQALVQENIRLDILKLLGTYPTLLDVNNIPTCSDIVFEGSRTFGRWNNSPACRVKMDFVINFRFDSKDGTVQL